MFPIRCCECSREFHAARANTKRCPGCRLDRSLDYVIDRHGYGYTIECFKKCGNRFAPLEIQRDRRNSKAGNRHKFCADCVRSTTDVTGTCLYCERERPNLLHELVPICRHCAMDPSNRRDLVSSLASGKRLRKLASGKADTEAPPSDERRTSAPDIAVPPRHVTDAARKLAERHGIAIEAVPSESNGCVEGYSVRKYAAANGIEL